MSIDYRTTVGALAHRIARTRDLDPRITDELIGVTQDIEIPGPEIGEPGPESLGALYERRDDHVRNATKRKRFGAYYTGTTLVAPTVQRALEPILDHNTLAIVDPSVGGGAFLLEAFRAIADSRGGDGAARRRAIESVYGVDIDPHAVRIARASLWLEASDPTLPPQILERTIRRGNSCLGAWPSAVGHAAPRVRCDEFCARWIATTGDAFHWQHEFPEPFARGGFDAVIGNPPWDIHKPDSRSFFAAVDMNYAKRDKQDALRIQRELLASNADLATRWQHELDQHKSFGRWIRHARSPFHRQGRGDANLYKLFIELAWELLRDSGRLGLLVPSGIYTDAGCRELRELLLENSQWEWLFGFENRRALFPIDGRYKFAAIVAQKGGRTNSVRSAFMRVDASEWADAQPRANSIQRATIERLSPRSLAIPELDDPRDLEIVEQIYANSRPFGADLDSTIRFRRELDQTQDSHRFPPRDDWERRGYRPNANGVWTKDGDPDDAAIPVYEGRMIGQYDFSEKGWVNGRGRRANWRSIPFAAKRLEPQFLLPLRELDAVDLDPDRPKIGFMAISSATNSRSMIAASLLRAPCGNSVPTLRGSSVTDDLCVLAVLNSFVFDWALRLRLGGTNLNQFVLAETPMLTPDRRKLLLSVLPDIAALSWPHPLFDSAWLELGNVHKAWAIDEKDRRARRARIDAAVARAFGLDEQQLDWILRDCDHDRDSLKSAAFTRKLNQKGFWRIDRELPPEERLPALTLDEFRNRQPSGPSTDPECAFSSAVRPD